jgi:prevent-host-death family protein
MACVAITVGMHEAKTTLSRLVDAALSGDEVLITRRGRPVAKLTPVRQVPRESLFGSLKGQIQMAEDFGKLPEDLLAAFEGK